MEYFFPTITEYIDGESGYLSDGEYSNGTIASGTSYPVYTLPVCQACLASIPICPAMAYEPVYYEMPPQPMYEMGGHSKAHVLPGRTLIKWNLPPPPVAPFYLFDWKPMPYGLETFWQSAFCWFFRPFWASYSHLWTFEPTDLPPVSDESWQTATYSAKVRFQCQLKHGWTSLKGRIVFWFRMIRRGSEIHGQALFKLYGQKCYQCSLSCPEVAYSLPLWYPEEIENAIRLLHIEVTKQFYGGDGLLEANVHRIRQGQPRKFQAGHHDPMRCQACHEGLCVLNGFK